MSPEIWNHSHHQWIQDLHLISLVQRRQQGQLIEVFKYLNQFTTASARGLFDYDLNDRKRNIGAKLIVKHFYPIKITTTTWNVKPNEVVSSRTVKSFKNSLGKHWAENLQMSELTCSNHWCRTNSCRSAFCWKWTQHSVLLLLLE